LQEVNGQEARQVMAQKRHAAPLFGPDAGRAIPCGMALRILHRPLASSKVGRWLFHRTLQVLPAGLPFWAAQWRFLWPGPAVIVVGCMLRQPIITGTLYIAILVPNLISIKFNKLCRYAYKDCLQYGRQNGEIS
jgi:hypothetical protein